MDSAGTFFDVFSLSLNRKGEELCGDQVKVLRTDDRTIAVLSDGLGSGVRASILARLSTEILVTMLRASVPLPEVLDTITGTLPISKQSGLAYATFVVAEIRHATGEFRLVSLDSPPVIFLKKGRLAALPMATEEMHGKRLGVARGVLEKGDFMGIPSDGVIGAGPGVLLDMKWNGEAIAKWVENQHRTSGDSAEGMVRGLIDETRRRYVGEPGDDATFLGIVARTPRRLMVFTGPPAQRSRDDACVRRLMEFGGRKIICGGTTANIVAERLCEVVATNSNSGSSDVPPSGSLQGVDLVTEGILTLARALQLLEECSGNLDRLPQGCDGATEVTREFLRADSIRFMAGESVNPYYQNPMLPRSVSIRRNLVARITALLTAYNKEVVTEWC